MVYQDIFNSLLSDYLDSKQDNQPKPGGQSNTPQDKQPTSKPSKGGESKDGGQLNQNQQGGGNDFNSTISETSALVDLAGKMGDLLMKDPNVQQQMQGGQSQFGQPQAPGITPFGRDVDRAISEVFPQQGPNPTSIMYDELQKLIAAPMQSPGDIVSKNAALASKYALEGNVKLANRHAQTADYLADALQKVEPYHTANLRMQSDREERRAGLQKEVMRTGAGIQERRIAGEADVRSRQYATDVAIQESRRKAAEDQQPEILARGSEAATLAANISSSISESDPESTALISSHITREENEENKRAADINIDNYAADAVFNKGFSVSSIDNGPLNHALTKATQRITELNTQLANLRQYGSANAATLTDFNSRIDEANTIRSKLADLKEAVKTKVKSYSEQKAYLEEVQRQAIGRDPWSQTRYTEKGVEYTERPSFVENRNKAQQEMQSAEYLKILQQQTEVKNRKKPK